MKFNWVYFEEPRKIGFGVEKEAVACYIGFKDKITYWVKDEEVGFRSIEIKSA